MTPEELDRILSGEKTVEPSVRFAANVLAAVRREGDEPPPLRFPWWRFGAGVVASGSAAVGGTVLLINSEVYAAGSLPAAVPAVIYALAMLLVSLGVAAVPHVLREP